MPPPTARFQLVTTAIEAEAVAFLESVAVKMMLPGVADTVIELLTANVMVTAAGLLVACACNWAGGVRLSERAAMTKVAFLKNFKLYAPLFVLV